VKIFNSKYENLRWRTKIVMSPYSSKISSDFDENLYAEEIGKLQKLCDQN